MSLRNQLLAAIDNAGGATINDLEESTGLTRKKLHDNIKNALTDDLLTRSRDVVTGLPYYQLTAKGHQRLVAPPNAKLFHEQRQPQPAVGKNTGSRESVPPLGQVSPPAEVAASEGNAEAGHDASAGSELSGELRFALGMIRKALGIDHDPSIGIVPTIDALIESNNDWRASVDRLMETAEENANKAELWHGEFQKWMNIASHFGIATPNEMAAAINHRNERIADLETQVAFLQAELWHGEFQKLMNIASHFGIAAANEMAAAINRRNERIADLETQVAFLQDELKATPDFSSNSGFTAADTIAPRYLVVYPDELYQSPQEAAESCAGAEQYGGIVIECRAIGTVQVKAVFVPHPEAGQ